MEARVSRNIHLAALFGAAWIVSAPPAPAQPKDAEPATRQANAQVLPSLPFSDRTDFDDAQRGFIASMPNAIMSRDGQLTIWSMNPYAVQHVQPPATLHPNPVLQ